MKTLRAVLGIASIVLIAVCVTLIGMKLLGNARVADLTEHRLYQLSDGTRAIVTKLNQPVTLKLYYARTAALKGGEEVRRFNNYYRYVRSLLEEYVRLSGGKLKLEVIDPRPFTDQEQQAMEVGVTRLPISEEEGFFFGLSAQTDLGKHRVIKFFHPARQELVEYDVSKLISDLLQRDKKVVGVLSPLPVAGANLDPYLLQMLMMQGQEAPRPWTVVEHLRQAYDVKIVQAEGGRLSETVDFLMVVHPKELDEQTRFAIDQHVMNGGQLAVFVDPFCLVDQPPRDPTNIAAGMYYRGASNLNGLLERWGVTMDPNHIAADMTLAMTPGEEGGRPLPKLPTLMALLGDAYFNRGHPITKNLDMIRLIGGGSLRRVPTEGMTVEPLLQTSPAGGTWTPGRTDELRKFSTGDEIAKKIVPAGEPIMLACAVTGTFQTNFPNGIDVSDPNAGQDSATQPASAPATEPAASAPATEPASQPDSQPATKHLEPVTVAKPGARVVVVADVDMISDMLAYSRSMLGMVQAGGNAPFVMNILDYLAGSEDLIAIRTRGQFARPFTRVDEIEKQANLKTEAGIKEIQEKIRQYQADLGKLGGSATAENMQVVETQALQARQKLQAEIDRENIKLRRLQAERYRDVELKGQQLQVINMVAAPGVLLIVAIVLAGIRYARARRYAARRAEA